MQLDAIPSLFPLHGFRSLKSMPSSGADVLVVLCPFRLEPPPSQGRLKNLLSAFGWRNFLTSRVLYAANPRTPEQQVGYAKAMGTWRYLRLEFAMYDPSANTTDTTLTRLASAEDIIAFADGREILLSYADPLGLGISGLEKRLLRLLPRRGACHILNGRGRILPLDAATHGLLVRHRLLARYRLPEILFGGICLVIAPLLALIDALRQRVSQ